MSRRRGALAVTAVAFLLGALLVIQLRAQSAQGGLNALSAQDLTTLIANLNAGNDELRTEIGDLQAQLDDLRSTTAAGRSNVGALQTELQRIRLWAGLDPVQGQGVTLTVAGPVDAAGVNDLLNELRLAGAEALAVEGVRVVPGSVVGGNPGGLSIENTALPSPVHVQAIGDPANLQAILGRPGGVIGRITSGQPGVEIEVQPSVTNLALPGSDRDLVPSDGKPHA
jgi:uncharacterized protein YlxW (UPF0749 family)